MTESSKSVDPGAEKVSILLVDDNPSELFSVRAILAELGQDIIEAQSGEEALELMQSDEFAVVLVDVQMPGLGGFETAKQIRERDESRHTPIIFLTGDSPDRPQLEQAYALGAVDVLIKPVLPLILRAKVRGFVELFGDKQRAKHEADQLKLLVHGTTEYAIFMLDPTGRIATWNAGAERIKGYKSQDIIGQHFSRFYPQEAIDRGWPEYELKVAKREGRFEDEGWRLRKDGTQFWANVVITALWDDQGQLRGFSKVTRDLTERKKAEESLRRSEERFRLLVEGAKDYAIFLLDSEGHVASWNTGAERIKRYKADEIIGQHFSKFYPQEALDRDWPAYELKVAKAEGRFEDEGWRVRKDGTQFWANVIITALRDEQGQLRGFSKITRDMTERKLAEENARRLVEESTARRMAEQNARLVQEQRDRLHVTLASIGDAVISTDADGIVEFMNSVAEELVGLRSGEAAGQTLTDVFHIVNEDTRRPVENPALRALGEGRIVGLANHTILISKKGEERPIDDSAAPIRDSDGNIIGSVLVFRDISERKRNEQQLREQQEWLRVTLASIGDAVIATDTQGRVTLLNPVAEQLTGWTQVEAQGQLLEKVFRIINEQTRETVENPVAMVLRKGTIVGLGNHTVLIAKDESERPIDDSAAPIRDSSGQMIGVVLIFRDVTEQRRAESEVTASAQRLNLALSAADLGDWSWDAATDIVTLSQRAAEVFGIPSGPHMTWTTMMNLLHPDDRMRAKQEVERIIIERAQYDIEYRVIREDGSQVWVGVLGRAVYKANDEIVGMYGIIQDITDRKTLEESFRSSEERLRLALTAGRMGVWDWNLRTGDIKWSESLEPLHGLAPGTFGGTFEDFQNLIHPDDREAVASAIRRAVEDANGYDIEFRNIWPNGSIHWIAGKGKVFPADDGQPGRMIGIGMDVTQRKRAEQIARFLADASAALAVLVDFDSTLQKVASLAVPSFADWATVDLLENDGTLRRVAVAHADRTKVGLAHEVHRRFPPDPSAPQGLWNIIRTGQAEMIPVISDELLTRSIKEPELLSILRELGLKSYIGVPLKVRGKTLGVITFIAAESGHRYDTTDFATAQDLADRAAIAIENAQLYRELREADRRKDEFLATLAHELRNPLAPIRNGLQVLRLAGAGGSMVEDARSMMERQLGQMVRLVDDLLDVSRITRNKLELRKERITLAAVIHSAVETSRPLIEQAGHTFSLTLPPSPVYLEADLTRLAQVFSNLLNNAAKYTESGGRISLSAELSGNDVVVRVRDNGLGIPVDALPRIFEMFSQVDRNLERAQGGLGIGLTLVRRLVEMHGGTVEARSDGPGRGSEFTVRLPILKLTREQATKDGDVPTTMTVKRRILIVDDNHDSAVSLAMMLKLMGNETHTAHDGLAAVRVAEEFRPDVILLDIGLPKLNGYDACRRIREQSWSNGIVIVALTGWGQDEDRRRSQAAGFDHHLVKPVELTALQALLNEK